MRTWLKWLGRIALAILLLLVVAAGVVYALSERVMSRTYGDVVELDEDFTVPVRPGVDRRG